MTFETSRLKTGKNEVKIPRFSGFLVGINRAFSLLKYNHKETKTTSFVEEDMT